MTKVRLNNGTEIEATLAFYADRLGVIHIYTDQLTMTEACMMFDDPEATKSITFIDEGETDRVFTGYTDLYAVQKGRAVPGEGMILIWLQPPNKPFDQAETIISSYAGKLNL